MNTIILFGIMMAMIHYIENKRDGLVGFCGLIEGVCWGRVLHPVKDT
jgi:hypothetical protein